MNTSSQDGHVSMLDARKGPGDVLAQARSDLRLTQEEVAGRLHLATRQIQLLEQDDYSGLPGPTYVRGYLRSYALLLGVDPETVLKAHARLTAKPATPDFSAIAPQKQITSRHHQIRFVTYVVVIIVIGLAIAWWQNRDVQLPSPVSLAQTEPTATVAEPVAEPAAEVTPATPLTATVPAPVPTPDPIVPMAKPTVAPVVAPAPQVVPPAVVSPNAPRVRFVLHADQEAWVDIRDALQNKLLYETVAAGRSVPLEGVAPVSIYLGNPTGTRIEMNGAPIDIERHRRGLTARFTLGETAAVPAR